MTTPITLTIETIQGGRKYAERIEFIESELLMYREPRLVIALRTLEVVDRLRRAAGREALRDEHTS